MRLPEGEFHMKPSRFVILIVIVFVAIGSGFTQNDIPTPSPEQQAQFQASMKEVRIRRQALQSAASTKMSLVNCGQLTLAQSQLETADARLQLVLTKVAGQLGLDSGLYEAVEDKDGRVTFKRKQQASASPSPN
jgi:hypothetical protein